MPALHQPTTIFSLRHLPTWLLLALSAGAVNAGAFLACQRFVTHVTGSVTRIGLDGGRWTLVAEYALVVLSFIVGAMASVFSIGARYHRGRRPIYAAPLVAVALVLAVVALGGAAGWFGAFGGTVEQPTDFALLCILSFGMGLQNAAVTTSTGALVRTTHMTGPATDLGIHLATAWFAAGNERRMALRHAALRAGKIVAFVAGAGAMVPLVSSVGFLAFLAPAAVVLAATALSFVPAWSAMPAPTPEPAR